MPAAPPADDRGPHGRDVPSRRARCGVTRHLWADCGCARRARYRDPRREAVRRSHRRAVGTPRCAHARGSTDRLVARPLMRACIAGWGAAVPAGRLTNADLEARVDTSDQWIVERTGIRERRYAAEGETTATLAIEAGANAIKSAGLTPDAIDLLVVATATPEQPIPHTGAFVGDGLGLRCASFDINVGCAG